MTLKDKELFERTVRRLTHEVHNLRGTAAAMLAASNQHSSNLFLQVGVAALQSDLLVRLIRVLERDRDVASSGSCITSITSVSVRAST